MKRGDKNDSSITSGQLQMLSMHNRNSKGEQKILGTMGTFQN